MTTLQNRGTKHGPGPDEWGLWLYFSEGEKPVLVEAFFKQKAGKGTRHLVQSSRDVKGFKWCKAVRAFSHFIIEYVRHSRHAHPDTFKFFDPPRIYHENIIGAAQSLSYALKKKPDWLTLLFKSDAAVVILDDLFNDDNGDGKKDYKRIILKVKTPELLPPKEIRIYQGDGLLGESATLGKLHRAIEMQEPDFKKAKQKQTQKPVQKRKPKRSQKRPVSRHAVSTSSLNTEPQHPIHTKTQRVVEDPSVAPHQARQAAKTCFPFHRIHDIPRLFRMPGQSPVTTLIPSYREYIEKKIHTPELFEKVLAKLNANGFAWITGHRGSGKTVLGLNIALNGNFTTDSCYYLDLGDIESAEEIRAAADVLVTLPQNGGLFVLDNTELAESFARRLYDEWSRTQRRNKLLLLGLPLYDEMDPTNKNAHLLDLEASAVLLTVRRKDILGIFNSVVARHTPGVFPLPGLTIERWHRAYSHDLFELTRVVSERIDKRNWGKWKIKRDKSNPLWRYDLMLGKRGKVFTERRQRGFRMLLENGDEQRLLAVITKMRLMDILQLRHVIRKRSEKGRLHHFLNLIYRMPQEEERIKDRILSSFLGELASFLKFIDRKDTLIDLSEAFRAVLKQKEVYERLVVKAVADRECHIARFMELPQEALPARAAKMCWVYHQDWEPHVRKRADEKLVA